jgi:hypothetical protein
LTICGNFIGVPREINWNGVPAALAARNFLLAQLDHRYLSAHFPDDDLERVKNAFGLQFFGLLDEWKAVNSFALALAESLISKAELYPGISPIPVDQTAIQKAEHWSKDYKPLLRGRMIA